MAPYRAGKLNLIPFPRAIIFSYRMIGTLLLLCLLSVCCVVFAEEANYLQSERQLSITQKLAALDEAIQSAEDRIHELHSEVDRYAMGEQEAVISKQQLNRASISLALAQTDLLRIEQSTRDAQQQHSITRSIISDLKAYASQTSSMQGEYVELKRQQRLYQLQIVWLDQLEVLQAHYQKIVGFHEILLQRLWQQYYVQQKQTREINYARLSAEQQIDYARLRDELNVNRQLRSTLDGGVERIDAEMLALDATIFALEEQIKLTRFERRLSYLTEAVADVSVLVEEETVTNLDTLINKESANYLRDLLILKATLQENIDLIGSYQQLQERSQQQGIINLDQLYRTEQSLLDLMGSYEEALFAVITLENQLTDYLQDSQQRLAIHLAVRKGLPGFDLREWVLLGERVLYMPIAGLQYLEALADQVRAALVNVVVYQILVLAVSILFWLLMGYFIRRYTDVLIRMVAEKRQRITENLIYSAAWLLRRNLFGLIIVAIGVSFFVILDVPFKSYALLFYLTLVWFAFRVIIGIARLTLVERISDTTGNDVRLYRGLKWTFILGGLITALTVTASQLKIAPEVQDLFVRFFMFFLLAVSLVLLRGYKVVPSLLKPFIGKRRLYLARATDLLSLFIPLTLMSVAVIGLVGYIELAWTISYYQLIFVLFAVGYIMVRGVIVDLMDVFSTWVIRSFRNGWLWSEALLKPVDKVLRIVVFLGAVVLLFYSYGWAGDSLMTNIVHDVLNYAIFNFPGGSISLIGILKFLATVAVFIWAARWIKEFTYRWVFQNVRDPGMRYSLSVFSQYAMVILGAFITLQVLGIDLTGMAVILGGLAVGLGFGLRDFANNIVSGVMLLIERPIKEGDIITVGEFEGEVKHIGIRSLMLQSWDHMEVMVPNSEVFNSTFTNWTHQDDIIRTVLPVKVQRSDNLYRIQQLITDVLGHISDVLLKPKTQIFLRDIGDSLIEFEVRYFINVRHSNRFSVKSQVLFAIWKVFSENNIKPPYPQQTVRFYSDSS